MTTAAVEGGPLEPPGTMRCIGGREFDVERQVAVLAVVNRTPDSFYDRDSTFALDSAIQAAVRAAESGADWVDIGGVPFGRGPAVSVQEELDRVVPVVAGIAERSDVVVSVDTTRAEVARASIAAGAGVVNDTSGLHDPGMLGVLASSSAQRVITHSLGAPRSEPELITVDPGHDLNKNTLHTLELTRRLACARLPPPQCDVGGVSTRIDGLSPPGRDLSDGALLALYAEGTEAEWLRVDVVASAASPSAPRSRRATPGDSRKGTSPGRARSTSRTCSAPATRCSCALCGGADLRWRWPRLLATPLVLAAFGFGGGSSGDHGVGAREAVAGGGDGQDAGLGDVPADEEGRDTDHGDDPHGPGARGEVDGDQDDDDHQEGQGDP
ncbi:hypothetical protein C5D07_11930 [Rathayibacter tritici]|nr:hypothetical protein C5C06_13350 [Rathayibacter tritici]PPI12577.1 hypothetical protein C5D07_11930 [Rathayibacter tritici]